MLEDFRLKIFLKVSETGSFTLAAKELGISQPAVSQSITALEKSIGTQLLTRARGEVYLTPEGLAFKEYAIKILYWYDAAQAMFGAEGKITVNRPIRIAADQVVSSYLLPQTLSAIYASHPEASFVIDGIKPGDGYSDNMFEAQDHGTLSNDVPGSHFGRPEDADVEISMAPSPETMDFEGESRLVGVIDAAVVCSPMNRSIAYAADAELKPFSTLAGIHVSNKFAIWKGYVPLLTPDLRPRTAVASDSIEAIKSMVAASDSLVGIVPAISVRRELEERRLIQLPVPLPDYSFDCHFNPLPEFASKSICKLLIETIKSSIH